MRGISEEELLEINPWMHDNQQDLLNHIIEQCRELQEPWMTLEEFLKSGFDEIDCWIFTDGEVDLAKFNGDDFCTHDDYHNQVYLTSYVTHVMPIHKPESPKL